MERGELGLGSAADPSVDQKIRTLNKSGKLCTKIDLSKVGPNMQRLFEPIALQLLKDVDANADMLDKPNHLLADASRKIFESGHGDVGKKIAEQIGILMSLIRWVNSNISLGHALSVLQDMAYQQALHVLKSLVEKAEEMDDPRAFIRREKQGLERHAQGKGQKGAQKGGSQKGRGRPPFPWLFRQRPSERLSARLREGRWQSKQQARAAVDRPRQSCSFRQKQRQQRWQGQHGEADSLRGKVAKTVAFINKNAGLAATFT